MNSPFNNSSIRDWFFKEIVIFELGVKNVVTLGSGPFEESDFDEFLKRYGFNPCVPSETIETLIVGEDFDEADVLNVLKLRAGKTLRVYSQEMFLSSLASGVDPLNSETGIDKQFAEGHSAINYLLGIRFKYPDTHIEFIDRIRPTGGPDVRDRSMLSRFGYKVGKHGMSELDRMKVIEFVFTEDLTANDEFDQQYIDEWGEPETPHRLSKIVDLISIDRWKAKMQTNENMSIAIENYESDLRWIKKAIYRPFGFQFSWPEVHV